MSDNKIKAYETIKNLVYKFESNYSQYNDINYNETMTRRDFIDPFFEALGWDVSNKQGFSETYRDVVHEDKLKIRESKNNVLRCKAPDYAFRIGGNRVFFVEAKKPFVKLDNNPETAFQLRRYGYSASLGISILTDFEEIAIYDCSVKPNINDKSSVARIKYYNYKEYLNEEVFNFIYDTFARENIPRGSLEKYIADSKIKKGTSSVDSDFLNSLDNLRTKLADNINKLNKNLSVRDLNFAVQAIIDRIIFLRVAEDRNVEEYGRLRVICQNKSDSFYLKLIDVFRDADSKYNSGLFHLESDFITTNLQIDNKVIKEIIEELYYPISPYEFSVISVEIIGNAYEQFLGKTISINNRNKAVIDLKPEVRKAGGVYYTPEYIVDYIVRNSVGVMIEGKSPEEIAKIKIIDPACGSGSFLLGVYQYLLDYHLDYYKNKKQNTKFRGVKDDVLNEGGDGLSLWLKKRILVNNIFGVDIDANAVEVSKLSLLLKCLEGETKASLINNASLFNERALPSLEDNIKCGNSLIGSDFYKNEEMLLLDEDMQYKINCFDFEDEFKEVFKNGGFDVVVGNPPWGAELLKIEKDYLTKKYEYVVDYQSYQYFIFMTLNYLKENGKYGIIIPNTFILNIFAKKTRDHLLKISNLSSIVDISNVDVFSSAKVRSVIFIGNKSKNISNNLSNILFMNNNREYINKHSISQDELTKLETWKKFLEERNDTADIFDRIIENTKTLSYYCNVKQGYIPYRTSTLTKRFGEKKAKEIVEKRLWHSSIKEDENYQKELQGKDVKRYSLNWSGTYVKYGKWVSTYLPIEIFSDERILIREISGKPPHSLISTLSNEVYIHNPSILSVKLINNEISVKFILGILNSKLISQIFLYIAPKSKKGLFPKIIITDAKRLPIPKIDLQNKKDKEIHDKIVTLVDKLIELNKKIYEEKNPTAKNNLQRQANAIDKQIDSVVYSLYKLSDDEVKIIENS